MKLVSRRRLWTVLPFINSTPHLNLKFMNSIYPGRSLNSFLFSFKTKAKREGDVFKKRIVRPYLKYAPGNFVVKFSHDSELFQKLQIFLAFCINFMGFIAVCMKQILIDFAISKDGPLGRYIGMCIDCRGTQIRSGYFIALILSQWEVMFCMVNVQVGKIKCAHFVKPTRNDFFSWQTLVIAKRLGGCHIVSQTNVVSLNESANHVRKLRDWWIWVYSRVFCSVLLRPW